MVKITSYLENIEFENVIYSLNNYKTHVNWNQNLEYNNFKDNKISYFYSLKNEKYEILNLCRTTTCYNDQNLYLYLGKTILYIEFFDDNKIHRIIFIEPEYKRKIKLTQYIKVIDSPLFYVK